MPHSGGHSLKWPTIGRQYNPCRLGGPQRFRAGDKNSNALQVGRLSTQPLPLGGSPPLWRKGHSPTKEARRIIDMDKVMEQDGVKCFVVMTNRTDLAKFRGARVKPIREETLDQWMVAPLKLVKLVLTEDWSDDY